jgi:hypothetical protein
LFSPGPRVPALLRSQQQCDARKLEPMFRCRPLRHMLTCLDGMDTATRHGHDVVRGWCILILFRSHQCDYLQPPPSPQPVGVSSVDRVFPTLLMSIAMSSSPYSSDVLVIATMACYFQPPVVCRIHDYQGKRVLSMTSCLCTSSRSTSPALSCSKTLDSTS